MNRKNLILGTNTLIVGMVLLSANAWAGTIEIPVTGTQTYEIVDPGVQFTDSEGILHYRGMVQTAQLEGQDIDGVHISGVGYYVLNINIDLATGNGDMNLKLSTESTYGELAGSWRGIADLTITGFVYQGPFNYSRGSDDFAGWHWRGTITGVFGVPELGDWEGVFHIPGGDKAAATEAETWSGIKDLFR